MKWAHRVSWKQPMSSGTSGNRSGSDGNMPHTVEFQFSSSWLEQDLTSEPEFVVSRATRTDICQGALRENFCYPGTVRLEKLVPVCGNVSTTNRFLRAPVCSGKTCFLSVEGFSSFAEKLKSAEAGSRIWIWIRHYSDLVGTS
ncbi:hypothetical protein ATANTOWER_015202 [Ataeniobius toweri]|uniref:Uncharacterized protein n=1 Tax=Ataeniobius toweri TaxID=208326 RepID=A0ABU7APL6_9TELE|nr:hypothetical protein [Ataeniobius toweri]